MYSFYSSNELKPKGWLLQQLKIQAEGLSGNLDKVWRDVRDSGWLGGDAESWERFPYWLDGFIPLAYLLEDKEMISRAKYYVSRMVALQRPDGWICPCSDEQIPKYDTWVIYLVTKVLLGYYECSRDESIVKVIYDILKNYYTLLSSGKISLFGWGKARWFECFIALDFLFERYREQWMADLAKILQEQGTDYRKLVDRWKRPMNYWRYETHIVNMALMLKTEAVTHNMLNGEYKGSAEYFYDILYRYNGTPVGIFTGDECLSGLSPIQGTELCSVVDEMYSIEKLFAVTGDYKWAERLELIAFNALPATISDDMWTHQYDQMSNQIACIRFPGRSLFRTNNSEAHIFGLEPSYGCCTANFHQGWPKFALSAFMKDRDKIISVIPVPSALDDEGINIELVTDYPFKNTLKYIIRTDKDFKFVVRIPSFAENITINGNKTEKTPEISFELTAGDNTEIIISFDTLPYFENRPYGLKTVKCGSLVFSLPVEYEKKMHEYVSNNVERKFPYCDYEYIPRSTWNFGFADGKLKVNRKEISDIPFSSSAPPVTVTVKMAEIDWGLEDGFESVCAKIPESTEPIGEEREMQLYPYGCAKLRVTEIPFVNIK
jgi:hypothetical protein